MGDRERRVPTWLLLMAIVAGAGLIALAVWLDVRDGVPTTRKGDQPLEVIAAGGAGIMLLGNGVVGVWRAYKRWRGPKSPAALS